LVTLTHKNLQGNWGTLLLPINDDESIDFARLSDEIDYLIDAKIDGIYSNGTAGELHVRGFSVMDGYYKRERAEIFHQDGWFATGDLGLLDADGYFYFQSRRSDMIKAAGANVAPMEVEALLMSYGPIQEAVVFGLPDKVRGQIVAAVLVPREGQDIDLAEVQARLKKDISAYKVPSRMVMMKYEDVPRTASGKPRKGALRDMLADGTSA